MASQNNLNAVFTDIANAIRDKKGSVNTIKPINMADEISSIISKSYIKYYGINQKCYFETDITTIPEGMFGIQYVWNGSTNYLTDVYFPYATTKSGYVFRGQKYLSNVYLPLLEGVGGLYFGFCTSLINIELPKLQTIENEVFSGCSSLEKVDMGRTNESSNNPYIGQSVFLNCSSLKTFIIRNSKVATLLNSNTFNGTPIATSTTEGYVYVRLSLVENYRDATNWITYKNKIMPIDLLEGNYVEVDLGTLSWEYNSGHLYFQTSSLKNVISTPTNNGRVGNIIANGYGTTTFNTIYGDNSIDMIVSQTSDNGLVQVRNLSYTDPTAFKNAIKGTILRYLPKE